MVAKKESSRARERADKPGLKKETLKDLNAGGKSVRGGGRILSGACTGETCRL